MPICEIDFRPMTVYKGRSCEYAAKRWDCDLNKAVRQLVVELTNADVLDAIIETNHQRADYTMSGRPRSGVEPSKPAIQVWFKLDDRPICFPSSRYDSWIQNIKAVGMTLERQRLIRDYGCVTIEEQFSAFAALPGSGQTTLTKGGGPMNSALMLLNLADITDMKADQVLADPDVFHKVFKSATLKAHPDKGGSQEMQAAVNRAREEIRVFKGW